MKIPAKKNHGEKIAFMLAAIFIIPLAPAQTAGDDISYSVSLGFDGNGSSLLNVQLAHAHPMSAGQQGEYTVKTVSFGGKTIFETGFNVSGKIFAQGPDNEKANAALQSTALDLIVPYGPNVQGVFVLKGRDVLLEIDVSKYAQCNENSVCDGSESAQACPLECTCGNGVCNESENYLLCSRDCKSGAADGVCDMVFDSVCDPDCGGQKDADCQKAQGGIDLRLLMGAIITLAVLVAAGVFALPKLRQK